MIGGCNPSGRPGSSQVYLLAHFGCASTHSDHRPIANQQVCEASTAFTRSLLGLHASHAAQFRRALACMVAACTQRVMALTQQSPPIGAVLRLKRKGVDDTASINAGRAHVLCFLFCPAVRTRRSIHIRYSSVQIRAALLQCRLWTWLVLRAARDTLIRRLRCDPTCASVPTCVLLAPASVTRPHARLRLGTRSAKSVATANNERYMPF
jgi:hypothetical protein